MRAAIYARVSTREQSAGMQLRELRSYLRRRKGVQGEPREYVDEGFSGAVDRRPGLERLMADARRRLFDLVVVWKFDRFGRSVKHLITALDEFRALGIEFVSITEAVDTSSPIGRVLFSIVTAIAEFERDLIGERVRAGLARAKALGKVLGRPARIVDVAAVQSRMKKGESLRSIAPSMGVDRRTLSRRLAAATPRASSPRRRAGAVRAGRRGSSRARVERAPRTR